MLKAPCHQWTNAVVSRCDYLCIGMMTGAFGEFRCVNDRSSQTSASTTMPHRALMVDEILREVTARVTRKHPPTAVALACCSKFFEEPALSELWKTQQELPTLIKTLPPDSWELQIGEAEDAIVSRSPQLDWYFAPLEDP